MTRRNVQEKGSPGISEATAKPARDDFWEKKPLVIRQFLDRRTHYEKLGVEVAYTLNKLLKDAEIKVATITHRAKELTSFLEKIGRKSYDDPFEQITDFAGVRVVCYYPDHLPKVEQLIAREFDIVQKEDKTEVAGVDRFGYGGTHFLVRLGQKASGARYDELKDKVCEIQVRTVMQDAWAIFSHHLMYKHESEVPDALKRQINALAGALETMDFAFQAIRDKRDEYTNSVGASLEREDLSAVRNNRDSLREYLSRRFPERHNQGMVENFLPDWIYGVYPTLQHVDDLLRRTEQARDWYAQQLGITRNSFYPAWELETALNIVDEHFRNRLSMIPHGVEKIRLLREAAKLIDKPG